MITTMADADLRRLEREAGINPSDAEVLSKLISNRGRMGEEIDIYWKIRHKNGEFCSGVLETGYYNRAYFTTKGKVWRDKTTLYKFIQNAVGSRVKLLTDALKESEVIEYRTIEFEKKALEAEFEQAELEILRSEKADLLKKLAEKEKQLAKKERATK
jgi:hypothetical protein